MELCYNTFKSLITEDASVIIYVYHTMTQNYKNPGAAKISLPDACLKDNCFSTTDSAESQQGRGVG